jgi:hypothetical protein
MLSNGTSAYSMTWSVLGPTDVEFGLSLTTGKLERFLGIYKRYFLPTQFESSFRPEMLLYQGDDFLPTQFVTIDEGKLLKDALLRSSELVHEGELVD